MLNTYKIDIKELLPYIILLFIRLGPPSLVL